MLRASAAVLGRSVGWSLVIEEDDLDAVVLGAAGAGLVVDVGLFAAEAAGVEAPRLDPARRQSGVDDLGPGGRDRQELGRLAAVVGVADHLHGVGRVLLEQIG